MTTSIFSGGSLRAKLVAILGVFTLVAIGQVAVNMTLISQMQGTASSAQLYGKGRYLGASLLFIVQSIQTVDDLQVEAAQLQDIVLRMDERYLWLRQGHATRGIQATTDQAVLSELGESEGQWRNEIKPRIETILNPTSSVALQDEIRVLKPLVRGLIGEIEDSVEAYEELAQKNQREAELVQWLFLVLYIVLLCGVFWVMRGAFGNLNAAAGNLSVFARQLLAGASEQVAATQEQAAAVSQTNSTAEELDQTAAQAVEHSRNVMDLSRQVSDVGDKGAMRVEEAIQAMTHVQEQSERIASNILALAEKTQSVGKIISVVGDIAEQTNILAINAGIEASRDQVAGSGFSAVAREIKDLANQSRSATTDVRQILGEVQQATSSTVMLMEEGSKRVEQAISTVNSSRDVIDSLLQAVRENARSAAKISASSNQQAIGTSQIRQAMNDINATTNQSVAAVKQVEATAGKLDELSDRLKTMLNG